MSYVYYLYEVQYCTCLNKALLVITILDAKYRVHTHKYVRVPDASAVHFNCRCISYRCGRDLALTKHLINAIVLEKLTVD